MNTSLLTDEKETRLYPTYLNIVFIAMAVLIFLLSIHLISVSIGSFGTQFENYLIKATANPYVGLFIGLLVTALMQSSSTSTTIAVTAVASGYISLQGAIPIIIGANIGTTLTSTLIAMVYITNTGEFQKAVSAATLHDFFNILMAFIFLPIEMEYHLLEQMSTYASSFIHFNEIHTQGINNLFIFGIYQQLGSWLLTFLNPIVLFIASISLLLYSIKLLSKLLYDILIGKTKDKFETVVFNTSSRSFSWGFFLTSVVQSSSLTSSLIVPFVALGKTSLKKAFPFVLGANLGTTITALLAAIFQSEAALNLALAHLFFNLIGVILFAFVPFLRRLPIFLACKMGEYTLKTRLVGFAYILLVFFLIPFGLIYLNKI